MKKSILKSIDSSQQPVSSLMRRSKALGAQEEENAPQGSLSGALLKLQKAQNH